jgi:hypothetical protein
MVYGLTCPRPPISTKLASCSSYLIKNAITDGPHGGILMKSQVAWLLAIASLLFFAQKGFAKTPQPKASLAAVSSGSGEAEPLQVKGQTRNVSMMNVSQNQKDNVKFVSARKNYKEQILSTQY